MIEFSSKAGNLLAVHEKLTCAKTLPVFAFFARDFLRDDSVIGRIQKYFSDEKLVVRSSARAEDAWTASNAGAFLSVLDVERENSAALKDAVKRVIERYTPQKNDDEVFIQPMLRDVRMAGVAFSADVSSLAPYFIIQYDDSGGTEGVTSGGAARGKTYITLRHYEYESNDSTMRAVIRAVKELELFFTYKFLDVEFAITNDNELYILQVRPIITENKKQTRPDLTEALYKVYRKTQKLQQKHPNLLGNTTMFAVMTDWNPAEMIGIKPKPLALSLYKELITDSIWAYQRDSYGYRSLRSHPLLISFLGVPFIDVRVDFNSFIPKNLDEKIAQKLLDFYLDKLRAKPSCHDKVEFEIVYSCYTLDIEQRLRELENAGFSRMETAEIQKALVELTEKIIGREEQNGLFAADVQKIECLPKMFMEATSASLASIDKIYWLIEYCKRYGTLPFAGIARAAFIAVQFLKSFVKCGIINNAEYNAFFNTINTLPRQLAQDLVCTDRAVFLEKYGHLRPGAYDITSLRYDEAFDMYFGRTNGALSRKEGFVFSEGHLDAIDRQLCIAGIHIDAARLLRFIERAIEMREYAKFMFCKLLSEALREITHFANRFDISREDAAFFDIQTFREMYSSLSPHDAGTILHDDIAENKKMYEYTKTVRLPDIILEPDDIYAFYLNDEEPNYITLSAITARTACEDEITGGDIAGKIVFIKSADPGYDFLFTKNIGGLVTQFGGANSHMAIRCAELSLPAVIGAGEKNFTLWSAARLLEIKCDEHQVRVLA
jgi:phosphohistidine swiveling domain-containing protein